MTSQLTVVAGPDKGRSFPLQPGTPLLVGRSKDTQTKLNDPAASRVHCQVHFEGGQVVAKGHYGVDFHASDANDNNKDVALKVLLPEFSRNEEEMQRFVRAMKTVLPLRHPNLVTLYGAGKTGPYCWIAMEYVEGESLTQVIGRLGTASMLDWRKAFHIAVCVGRALEYAHGQHLVHRH